MKNMNLFERRNRRGAVPGKFITAVIVAIWVFLIIGVFIGLSVAAKVLLRPSVGEVSDGSIISPVLTEKISVNGKEKLVFDAYLMYENKLIEREELEKELEKLVNAQRNCLGLAKGESVNPAGNTGGEALDDFFIVFDGEKVNSLQPGARPLRFGEYRKQGLLHETYFQNKDGKIVYVEHYYGRCLK